MAKEEYGVIHEVGDMGLGFDPLSEEENEKVNESQEEDKDKKKEE